MSDTGSGDTRQFETLAQDAAKSDRLALSRRALAPCRDHFAGHTVLGGDEGVTTRAPLDRRRFPAPDLPPFFPDPCPVWASGKT